MRRAPARFARTLSELGAPGHLFAHYLTGRADLLPVDYLDFLPGVPRVVPGISRVQFALLLTAELGDEGDILAASLEPEPCWSDAWKCAYRTWFRDTEVAVQISLPVHSQSAFTELTARIRSIDDPEAATVLKPWVLRQFGEWMLLDSNPDRERAFLEALSEMRGRSLAEYPVLLPEFCRGRVLCWHWADGEPLPPSAEISAKLRGDMAAALLEQMSFLSFVDGDPDWNSAAISPQGQLIFRRLGRAVAIPAGRTRSVLRYIADSLSENSSGAARSLLELAAPGRVGQPVSQLLAEMAIVQPQLIRKENPPPFVRTIEGNWRALAATGIETPLFLSLMHRNLIAAGIHGEGQDFLQEAQATVLGSMLRSSAVDLTEPGMAKEWAAGAGMLVVDGLRTIARMAGDLRDGNYSRRSEVSGVDSGAAYRTRCVKQGVRAGVWLVSFLICLKASEALPQPWAALLIIVAAAAAGGLFWAVSRIG